MFYTAMRLLRFWVLVAPLVNRRSCTTRAATPPFAPKPIACCGLLIEALLDVFDARESSKTRALWIVFGQGSLVWFVCQKNKKKKQTKSFFSLQKNCFLTNAPKLPMRWSPCILWKVIWSCNKAQCRLTLINFTLLRKVRPPPPASGTQKKNSANFVFANRNGRMHETRSERWNFKATFRNAVGTRWLFWWVSAPDESAAPGFRDGDWRSSQVSLYLA